MNKLLLGLTVKKAKDGSRNEVRLPLPLPIVQFVAEKVVFPKAKSVCIYTPKGIAVFYQRRDANSIHRERRTFDGLVLENSDIKNKPLTTQ
jgi:hypothetical protein